VAASVNLTPEQRSLRASAAADALHATISDPKAHTAPARDASPQSLTYWERQLDPDGTMPPEERARRAEHARRSYMKRLALKSARARRARKAAPTGPDAA
jgi:hypothetical protein